MQCFHNELWGMIDALRALFISYAHVQKFTELKLHNKILLFLYEMSVEIFPRYEIPNMIKFG